MYILGISCYYHDSAACLISSGKIISCAQEERFSRKKHDSSFPKQAIQYCLDEANIQLKDIDFIGFYDKPFLKFERILETYLSEAPRGYRSFLKAIPLWIKEKLFLKKIIVDEIVALEEEKRSPRELKKRKQDIQKILLFGEHHLSHAASCYYPSPFEESAILTMDGVGEWVTTSIAHGKENKIHFLKEIHFPHSLGLLYSAITYFLGFKVNSGEYKVMGLSPYGKPLYVDLIKDELVDIKEDGSFRLNMKYFNYTAGMTMTNRRFNQLFKRKPRVPESEITQFEMDLAKSIQVVIEEIVLKLAKTAKEITKSDNLVMSGGVALNCVANGKILEHKIFKKIWIQPASGDAGGSLGIALAIYFEHLNQKRMTNGKTDAMNGAFLGKKYSNEEVESYLNSVHAKYHQVSSKAELIHQVASFLSNQKVVGWHQGRMEFGPRALGARSILGDPKNSEMQSIMNLKIKHRESFRPFAPAILREKLIEYFEMDDIDNPYMLFVAPVKLNLRKNVSSTEDQLFGIEKLKIIRSTIPAVTHVDYSARVQTVHASTNPLFYNLIEEFEKITGCPILINTSFNVRGEPIVCSPQDSYFCFMKTGIDVLAIEDFILLKEEQPLENHFFSTSGYELD